MATTKKNLFSKAKDTAPKKAAAGKDEKTRITIEDPSFFDKIEKLEKLQDNLKRDKASADIISDELRDLGRQEWSNLYQSTSRNPGSVMLEHVNDSGDTSQLMFIPADNYIKINEERAEELRETFGEDIVEEKTVYSFDADMIEKYGQVISELIENSDKIAEKDREKIIKAVTSFSIAKGTIDKLKTYGDVEQMIEAVRPIVSLKNVEIVKG